MRKIRTDKQFYIDKISKASDRYGDKLVELMTMHNASNLQEVTFEQAKSYYERMVQECSCKTAENAENLTQVL